MADNSQDTASFNTYNTNLHVLYKISVIILCIYLLLTTAFYFLAGEQLHFRRSKAEITMETPNSATVELSSQNRVEQVFVNQIERLQSVSILWGTYYRENTGQVLIELYQQGKDTPLLQQSILVADITEGYVSTMTANPPIEGLKGIPLSVRITATSNVGQAVSPMMNTTLLEEGRQLYLNGEPALGGLCFSAQGEDYIWTGMHYWKLLFAGLVMLILYLCFALWQMKKGRIPLPLAVTFAMKKYSFLIRQLIARDFKAKYKRSVLGVLWSFLNPLLTMMVQYIVFSNLFRFDVPNYSVYLLCGIIIFNFFSEACGMTLTSIVGNASLITKVYVPKYVYPLTRTISSLINLLIALVPLLAVILFSGLHPTTAYLLLPFVLGCLAIFTLGIGMLLASAMVFFRDTQFLWGVFSMIWMYLTPIFYPESILPKGVAWVLECNPLHYFIKFTRMIVIEGISPEPRMYMYCALFALGSLTIGSLVFKKSQDKFALYI